MPLTMNPDSPLEADWSLWSNYIQWIHSQLDIIRPTHIGEDYVALTADDLGPLRSLMGGLESCVYSMTLIQWETYSVLLGATTFDALYAELRMIDDVYRKWRRLDVDVDELCRARNREFDHHNPLVRPLTEKIARSLQLFGENMHEYQACVRTKIGALSRLALRPLRVVDLPGEVLFAIFGNLRTSRLEPSRDELSEYVTPDYDRDRETRDIQNTRLTCKKFCDFSSNLLTDYVHLELEPGSLARLEALARNPEIRSGIRAVDVRLPLYHGGLAYNFNRFLTVWNLILKIEPPLPSGLRGNGRTRGFSPYRITDPIVCEIFKALYDFSRGRKTDKTDDLEIYYKAYRQLYKEQRQMLTNGHFGRAAAAAIAQIPQVKLLAFGDEVPFTRRHLLRDQSINDPRSVVSSAFGPFAAVAARKYGLQCDIHTDVMVDILRGLSTAGASIGKVSIFFDVAPNSVLLAPKPAAPEQVNSVPVCDQLSVKLSCTPPSSWSQIIETPLWTGRWMPPRGRLPENTHLVLTALLDSDDLRRVEINMVEADGWSLKSPSIGPCLTYRERPTLNHLRLAGVSFYEHEFVSLIGSLPARKGPGDPYRGIYVNMGLVRLLRGTWANVLDALRTKVDDASVITAPLGAEIADMAPEKYHDVFGGHDRYPLPDSGPPNLAEAYIRMTTPESEGNPLREKP